MKSLQGPREGYLAVLRNVSISMLLAVCSALVLGSAGQVIDGVKPISDPAPKFAQALVSRSRDDASILEKPDPFISAFFMGKAKVMAPLTQTKYTAAQMGICGTIINIYDPTLGAAIKTASDRISKGTKEFDTLTAEEREKIQKANGASPLLIIGIEKTTLPEQWQFFAGSYLGMLAGYTTLWHISPKNETLLQLISDGAKGCAEHGAKPEGSGSSDLAAALKAFSKFAGKKVDEATAREIGTQIEATLKAATPLKYRW